MSNNIEKQIYFGSKDELCHMSIGEVMSQYSEKNKNDYEPVSVGKLGIRLRSEVFGRQLNTDNKKNKVIYKNTLTIGMGSKTIDYSVLHQEKCYSVSPDYKTFNISHNIDSYYWDMYFKVIADKLFYLYAKENTRNGRRIDIDSLLKHKVTIPKNNSYIGKYLSSIDNLINLCNNAIKQKETLNSKLLQHMISNEEQSQKIKISEIFEITRGDVLSKENLCDSGYPVYSSQTKNNGLMGYYNTYLFEDCITWTTDGANAGDTNFREGKFFCTNVCGVLMSEKGYSNLYVAKKLNCITQKYVSFVGNPKLMNNVMGSIQIELPSLKKQEQFSKILSQMDKLIEIEEKKLEQLEKMKKYHLQQFFN